MKWWEYLFLVEKWWEVQREMEAHTHECGKCYAEGDCYCNDFAECCGTCYEVGDICEDCGEEVKVEEGGED